MMDIEWITSEFSKPHILKMVEKAKNDPENVVFLVRLMTGENVGLARRAAWALDHLWQLKPEMLHPHLDAIAAKIPDYDHTAMMRHAFKILSGSPLPPQSAGYIIDQAFEKLAHPTMPIAVKMFAMELLYRACLKEPALKHELLLLIDAQYEEGSAGFKSRAKRVRKGLEKVSSVPGAGFSF